MKIRFLTLHNVLALHKRQINVYGGQHGLRDEALLKSALAMPPASFGGEYLHASIAEMAGAYMFHLTMNHAFVDGNKRIGVACALAFIKANGYKNLATNEELETFAWDLAEGKKSKEEVIVFFQKNTVPV